jgi:hypothetical protein
MVSLVGEKLASDDRSVGSNSSVQISLTIEEAIKIGNPPGARQVFPTSHFPGLAKLQQQVVAKDGFVD